jgi:hypothetical protein
MLAATNMYEHTIIIWAGKNNFSSLVLDPGTEAQLDADIMVAARAVVSQ